MKPLYLAKESEIEKRIQEVNGRATAHTLDAGGLYLVARRAEKQMTASGLPKKLWRGVRVTYCPAGPGKAYARKARSVMTNRVTLEYRAGGWALVDFAKVDQWADGTETFRLYVAPEVLERVKEEACKPYIVDA